MGRTTDIKCYYSGTWKWLKPHIWTNGPPIGLYWTAAVQGPSSLWVEFTVSPHVHRKQTLYTFKNAVSHLLAQRAHIHFLPLLFCISIVAESGPY